MNRNRFPVTLKSYKVFQQLQPKFSHKDRNGDDVYVANLVELKAISATSTDEAFRIANTLTNAPVLERLF